MFSLTESHRFFLCQHYLVVGFQHYYFFWFLKC